METARGMETECVDNYGRIGEFCDELDHGEADGGRMEGPKVASRCAVRSVHGVVSGFDERKRGIVKSIGFGGLLHFPPLKQINKKFSVWLMSKVDEASQTIVIDDRRRFRFSKEDVGVVFGIPSRGKRVIPRRATRVVKIARSVKSAQEVLERDYASGMSKEEEDIFRVSFVVFVMSCLLAPGAKHGYASLDYCNALADPSESFDWAAYVIQHLLNAVVRLKMDLLGKPKVTNITGCSLFLQVVYLDSMDLGICNMDHNILPWIRCFTADRLRAMIAADSRMGQNSRKDTEFGLSNMRPPKDICYQWASGDQCTEGRPHGEGQGALWEAIVLMARRLKISTEAAGSVYLAMAEHGWQVNAMIERQGIELISAITTILEPFMDGFNCPMDMDDALLNLGQVMESGISPLHAPCCDDKTTRKRKPSVHTAEIICWVDRCPQHKTVKELGDSCKRWMGQLSSYGSSEEGCSGRQVQTVELTTEVADNDNHGHLINVISEAPDQWPMVDVMVSKAMSQFYLMARESKIARCIDLNKKSPDIELPDEALVRKVFERTEEPKSPWQLGFDGYYDVCKNSHKLKMLHGIQDTCKMKMPWFVHYTPKFIEVLPHAAHMQFMGQSEIEMDMFDALLRRLKQRDDAIYLPLGRTRWRHFVESDFLAALIADWPSCFELSIHDQFIGSHLGYDIPNCKMIFFPVILERRWVCYAWRMHDNVVVVFDPIASGRLVDDMAASHGRVVSLLKRGLEVVATKYFEGWEHDWNGASIHILGHPAMPMPRNRTGVLVAYFCRNFDGVRMNPDIDGSKLEDISALMLSEAIELSDNYGKLPASLIA